MAIHGRIPKAGPLILAIENSGLCGSVALVTAAGCLAEYSLISPKTHSKRLLSTIDAILSGTGNDLSGVDAVAISIGPGSFTGLRIGLATAKGICMAAGKPLIDIPTLEGLAAQLSVQPRQICAVLDARKKEVFAACYRMKADETLQTTMAPTACSPDRLAEAIIEPTLFIGDGVQLYGNLFQEKLADLFHPVPATLYFPRASVIGFLAEKRWHRKEFADVLEAAPLYLRASDAELHRKS
jgi:tRNA threonylcarbamoyladenosine biosynthesis protein TsaB